MSTEPSKRQSYERESYCSLRVSDEEKGWYREAAELHGGSVANWIRGVLREKLRATLPEVAARDASWRPSDPLPKQPNKQFQIRMSSREMTAYREAAALCGTTVSEWIRITLREKMSLASNLLVVPVTEDERALFLKAARATGRDIASLMLTATRAYAEVITKSPRAPSSPTAAPTGSTT